MHRGDLQIDGDSAYTFLSVIFPTVAQKESPRPGGQGSASGKQAVATSPLTGLHFMCPKPAFDHQGGREVTFLA